MGATVADLRFHVEQVPDRHIMELIEAKGRIWGWQWRRNFGDKISISIKSLMGRAKDEQHATLEGGTFERHYAEVFLGDALEFASALKHIEERHRTMAVIHYVIAQPAKAKAHEMDIAIQTYWQRRNSMRRALAKWMDV